MREIGAFEAKNRFSVLLAEVAQGEEITITHRGKPIARLVPAGRTNDRDAIRDAADRIRRRAEQVRGDFSWDEWKTYRDEGRS